MKRIIINRRQLLIGAVSAAMAATTKITASGAPRPAAPAQSDRPLRYVPISDAKVAEVTWLAWEVLYRENGHVPSKRQLTQGRWLVNATMEQLAFDEGTLLPLQTIIEREYASRPLRIPAHWRGNPYPGMFEPPYRSFRYDDGLWHYDPNQPKADDRDRPGVVAACLAHRSPSRIPGTPPRDAQAQCQSPRPSLRVARVA